MAFAVPKGMNMFDGGFPVSISPPPALIPAPVLDVELLLRSLQFPDGDPSGASEEALEVGLFSKRCSELL